jgi:hypothetical protein
MLVLAPQAEANVALVTSKFSKIVLGGTAASHTCQVWGAVFLTTKSDDTEGPLAVQVSLAHSLWLSDIISFRAKSPSAGLKAEMVARLIVEPEAFMQRLIFSTPQTLFPVKGSI